MKVINPLTPSGFDAGLKKLTKTGPPVQTEPKVTSQPQDRVGTGLTEEQLKDFNHKVMMARVNSGLRSGHIAAKPDQAKEQATTTEQGGPALTHNHRSTTGILEDAHHGVNHGTTMPGPDPYGGWLISRPGSGGMRV